MAKCDNCSAKLLPGQVVCKACGEPVDEEIVDDGPDEMLDRSIAGKYRILEALGEGAMGRVYRAEQTSLSKEIAIKVLHKHLAADPKVKKRFHREARTASRLSHPNSIIINDFGEDDDGTLYIAMELLGGDDLLTLIEGHAPLSPARILRIMKQVLSALGAAHDAGIIHRDLKPENVVVYAGAEGEEHVKVCDFGIAKIQEAEGGSAITVTGFVCGTPEYMAPEQARGEKLDTRADIYAAGCMLYQLLTDELPFTAESALGIITKHLTETPIPPRQRKPEWNIPEALERVCARAMDKDRDQRYQDARSMSKALSDAVALLGEDADKKLGTTRGDPTTSVRPDAGGDDSGTPLIVWALGLIVIGGLALAIAFSSPTDESPTDGDDGGDSTPIATPPLEPEDAAGPSAHDAMAAILNQSDAAVETARDAGPDAAGRRPPRVNVRRPPRPPTPPNQENPDPPPSVSPGQAAYEEGRRLFLQNDVGGAIRKFEEAARLMPNSAQVHKQLGRAYMRQGDVGRGVRAYRRYLELAPNATDREIIERLIESRSGG